MRRPSPSTRPSGRVLESVYHKALRVALDHRNIPYESEKEVHIVFEDVDVGVHFLDLLISGEIVVELKAVKTLEDIHFAHLRSYLTATGKRVGLLLNFNATTLVVKRVVSG